MSAEKTEAVILKTLPYRESSLILYLFTERHGLIHGIAKGIRSQKKIKSGLLERGFIIEIIVYIRPGRNIQTIGSVNILEYFPDIRTDIIKSALRDTAFEAILASITESDVHPELFNFFKIYLQYLNDTTEKECHPFVLWLFFHRFAQYMGFGLNLENCIICDSPLKGQAFLIMDRGGFECLKCSIKDYKKMPVDCSVVNYLLIGKPTPAQLRQNLSSITIKKVTRLLADYIRFHFNIQKEFNSLAFLEQIS